MKTKKEQTYLFTYLDNRGNELKNHVLNAYNMKEAKDIKSKLFAECMLNDCVKIKVALIC